MFSYWFISYQKFAQIRSNGWPLGSRVDTGGCTELTHFAVRTDSHQYASVARDGRRVGGCPPRERDSVSPREPSQSPTTPPLAGCVGTSAIR